ncbi:Sulfatase-modifying factor 1 [Pseudomonas reidholzensis]|uniref:Sulfatase-modifying factor 1 n=1 Tax=Pseudomonas reidholzensis TaxID=1785162 RepID=A0A383RYU8_9PSED|nr:formylglycine-generating enzyme family protein [Pseudomonas reidholzensis]SYX91814.1 Sulfatase-modifying factor 1 [Pseudomonas reidholzensis]
MKRVGIALGCLGVLVLAGILSGTRTSPPLGSVAGCQAYNGLPAGWQSNPQAGMLHIRGGRFTPGSGAGYPDERPLAAVAIEDFWIDRTEVTRAQFAAFVSATGYLTDAERAGAAAVFRVPGDNPASASPLPWWQYLKGANWRYPDGPNGPAAVLDQQPVTQVTLADAQAYAQWRGNTLPSEAQWEYAARAGGDSQRLGEEPRDAHGRPVANYWQGIFPLTNDAEDGFAGLAPVGCFAANDLGLFDMIGNVWEWTTDVQRGLLISHANGDPGLLRGASGQPGPRIIKGGSFLCATSYCARYRAAARERQDADLATAHVGFRTVRLITAPDSTQPE